MTIFWQRWLTLWCLAVGLFGLILYGVGFAATTAPAALVFALMGQPLPAEPDRYLRFAVSLMGAVTAGWAVTYFAVFRAAWRLDGDACVATWRLVTLGTLLWYAIDSWASHATGFTMNVASNSLLLVGYLVPVLATGVLWRSTPAPATISLGTS